MISPKYGLTHYFYSATELSKYKSFPHIVNLYLDYNCPFSAKLFLKFKNTVIPELQKSHPGKFQFVFVNVIQPWHPNSVLLHEFSLVLAKKLQSAEVANSNKLFWEFSKIIFENKEQFYDSANADLSRNEIYEQIASLPEIESLGLPFAIKDVVGLLKIKLEKENGHQSNSGNEATVDVKYFTKYLRGVGVHVTPTISVDGIVIDTISSGDEETKIIQTLGNLL